MAVYQRQSSKEYQLGHKKGAIRGGGRYNGIMGWLAAALWSCSWNETEQVWEIKVQVSLTGARGRGPRGAPKPRGGFEHVSSWQIYHLLNQCRELGFINNEPPISIGKHLLQIVFKNQILLIRTDVICGKSHPAGFVLWPYYLETRMAHCFVHQPCLLATQSLVNEKASKMP